MDNDLQGKINESLSWIGETIKNSQEFIHEQAPLYAQEVLEWALWSNTITAIISLLMIIIALIGLALASRRLMKGEEEGDGVMEILVIMIGAFIAITCSMTLFLSLKSAIKSQVAPRALLIEHIQGKIK